jgi:FixJ family two-component response regulator
MDSPTFHLLLADAEKESDQAYKGSTMTADLRTVYLVDDDSKIREVLTDILEEDHFRVLCFESAEAFLENVPSDSQGCLLLDLMMPGMGGVELQHRVLADYRRLATVVLTGAADVSVAVSLMQNGAMTLLEKPFQPHQLTSAVEQALEQSEQRSKRLSRSGDLEQRLATLSPAEEDVMKYMISGMSNKQAARELNIGNRTLDRRRAAVLAKLQVSSIAELASALTSLQCV